MTDNTITLTPAALVIVKADVAAFNRDRLRYGKYVAEMKVTADTVAAHVALFRDAYKAANPKADGALVKAYATKVRNGLNTNLGKTAESEAAGTKNLLTSDGVKALAGKTEKEIVAAILAEITARTK